jgi:hypothetical protein
MGGSEPEERFLRLVELASRLIQSALLELRRHRHGEPAREERDDRERDQQLEQREGAPTGMRPRHR